MLRNPENDYYGAAAQIIQQEIFSQRSVAMISPSVL